jgi:hypothetical protein
VCGTRLAIDRDLLGQRFLNQERVERARPVRRRRQALAVPRHQKQFGIQLPAQPGQQRVVHADAGTDRADDPVLDTDWFDGAQRQGATVKVADHLAGAFQRLEHAPTRRPIAMSFRFLTPVDDHFPTVGHLDEIDLAGRARAINDRTQRRRSFALGVIGKRRPEAVPTGRETGRQAGPQRMFGNELLEHAADGLQFFALLGFDGRLQGSPGHLESGP